MSRKLTKLLGLFLAMALMVSVLGACGASEKPSTESSQTQQSTAVETTAQESQAQAGEEPGWKKDTSPVTLDWYVNFSWFDKKWDTQNAKYITEKTGVTLNIMVPTGNETEKLNTMIAANQLPDLLTLQWNDPSVKKLEAAKLVSPLVDLANKYDPYFLKIASKDQLNWYTRDDGKVYGYPNFSLGPDKIAKSKTVESNQTFLVRKDIYEAIGKPDMRTPDGFLNALKAAKDKFANSTLSGKPLIPFAPGIEFNENGCWEAVEMLGNFLDLPMEKDGKLYDRISDPESLKWYKTLRKANEMGLMATDVFIDKRAQFEEKVKQARYFALCVQHVDIQPFQQEIYTKNPNMVYIAIDPPADANLDAPKLRGGGLTGWCLNYVTASSQKQERAMKFMTYLVSDEGQHDMFLGKKGETWDTIDGKDQVLPQIVKDSKTDPDLIGKKLGIEDSYWMMIDALAFNEYMPPFEEPLLQPKQWTIGKVVSFDAYDDLNPPADTPEGVASKRIGELWGTVQPKLMLAKSDAEFDKLFNDYITKRTSLGWDKVLAYQQQKFEANKKKLGLN